MKVSTIGKMAILCRPATRLAVLAMALTLAACGGGDGGDGGSATAPTVAPANLAVAYDVKAYQFSWDPVAGAAGYQVEEDIRGDGSDVSTGFVAAASYRHSLADQLLSVRLNARYRVRACNQGGCGGWSDWIKPDVTRAIGYFKGSKPQANSSFGYDVALSRDGRTLAVSAPFAPADQPIEQTVCGDNWRPRGEPIDPQYQGKECGEPEDYEDEDGQWTIYKAWITMYYLPQRKGAVYVFSRDDQGAWQQQARLVPPMDKGQLAFGKSIALSDDGSTIAIGAPDEFLNADEVKQGGAPDSGVSAFGARGAVYVFTRSGNAWSQSARLTALVPRVLSEVSKGYQKFGSAVALSGNGSMLAVGDPSESSNMRGVIGYGLPSAGEQTVDPKIFCNNTFAGSDSGGVHFFGRDGGTWTQRALIKAPNAELCDAFGRTVAFSRDGKVLAVGAPGEWGSVGGNGNDNLGPKSGAVYLYQIDERLVHGFPVFKQYLKGSLVEAPALEWGYNVVRGFGSSISLSDDGETLAIAPNGGVAYVFKRTAPWHWSEQSILRPAVAGMNFYFGTGGTYGSGKGLALTSDGRAVVVASGHESGAVPGINGDQTQYCSVAPDPNGSGLLPFGLGACSQGFNSPYSAGAAYRFEQRDGAWSQTDYFKPGNMPNPPGSTWVNHIFGASIALSGDGKTMAVGATGEGVEADVGIRADKTSYEPRSDYMGAAYLY